MLRLHRFHARKDHRDIMTFKTLGSAALAAILIAPSSLAQTGTLDQVSPAANAGFNRSAPSLIWQQQARAGIAGQLEGFELYLTGPVGAYLDVRVRVGDGWNTNATSWSGSHTKTTPDEEVIFFDVTSAGINLVVGDTYVIEVLVFATLAHVLDMGTKNGLRARFVALPSFLQGAAYAVLVGLLIKISALEVPFIYFQF